MSDTADDLYPGPLVDGRATFFCLGRHIPSGWERRFSVDRTDWLTTLNTGPATGHVWYQVREPLEPVYVEYDGQSRRVTYDQLRTAIGYAAADRAWALLTGGRDESSS